MNKIKLFVENFLVYGLGGIISKIIPLIMVPIVARIMPSSDYFGIIDLSNTIVSFACSIAVMGMYDAMYRLFFDKDDVVYRQKVCSTALFFTLATSTVVFIIMLIYKEGIAQCFFSGKEYAYVVYLSAIATLVEATNSIISAPTRMQNKSKIFLVTNTISPLISYGISIPMLLAGHYVIALPLAAIISGATMELSFGFLNRKWFSYKKIDKKVLLPMLKIAIPLLPNFLIYWLFNSCDKVMITNMIGLRAAGIYSVGSKLGNCSQLIYTAFAGGWQYFAFSTMREKDQVKLNSSIFEYLGIISYIATSFICAWSFLIFRILFPEQYWDGYIIAPYLFLAPLLQMLFQVAANQFLIVKKTWPNIFILTFGALVNIIINYSLIPLFGIEGAAIATLLGYIISDIFCVVVLYKMKLIIISNKFISSSIIMIVYFVIWRILFSASTGAATLGAFFSCLLYVFIYKEDLNKLIRIIKGKQC